MTDVFYAEEDLTLMMARGFQAFYDDWAVGADREDRMGSDPMLGYYGGGLAEGRDVDVPSRPMIFVEIENGERLIARVTYWLPSGMPESSVDLKAELTCGDTVTLKNPTVGTPMSGENGTTYTCTWILDELGDDGTRFSSLFTGGKTADLGGDFQVTAVLSSRMDEFGEIMGSETDNSLFASRSSRSGQPDLVEIGCLRHLQNLSSAVSGVSGRAEAVQTADILCLGNETYPAYRFIPIDASAGGWEMKSYDGGEYEIRNLYVSETAGDAGLFSFAADMRFSNIRLVNATVEAGNGFSAGALAGVAVNAGYENCHVFWSLREGDLGSGGAGDLRSVLGSNEENAGYQYRIAGYYAGGLAGQLYGGSVDGCLAATTVDGQTAGGGLFGSASGTVTVEGSYADCYLTGRSAAGLIGELSGTAGLTGCYAAGFIDMETAERAAGLCLGGGSTVTQSVYSAMRYPGQRDEQVSFMTEAPGDRYINSFYLGVGSAGTVTGAIAQSRDYAQMTAEEFTGELNQAAAGGGQPGVFARKSSRDSSPYNLRKEQNLGTYSFPGLAELPHYGDWGAEFQKPSLVYYERYSDGTFRFSGGNVNYLPTQEEMGKRIVVSDGYAVAFLKEKEMADIAEATVSYASVGGAPRIVNCKTQDASLIEMSWPEGGGEDALVYYLALMPGSMVNGGTAQRDFFQYLSYELEVGGRSDNGECFYNPHFAETVVPYVPEEGEAAEWTAASAESYAWELAEKQGAVNIRTARHLYNLSLYPEYYHSQRHRYVFRQRLNVDYGAYTDYGLFQEKPFRQEPIGGSRPFNAVYDGGCRMIDGVVFTVPRGTGDLYAGLFGESEGTLRNIVYRMYREEPEEPLAANADSSARLYLGSLVGSNSGTVQNCAAAGVCLSGLTFGGQLYAGGLVGANRGVIRSCAAEASELSADNSSYAEAHVGGFAGINTGSGNISASYAVGRLSALVDNTSRAFVCGFAGENAGSVNNCYAAADLRSSGLAVEISGFGGGVQKNTFFLNEGNFTYGRESFAASYSLDGDAESSDYVKLSAEPSCVPGMEKGGKTGSGEEYPYPTAVTNAGGEPVHYGDWPRVMELGEMGVYYWERLETGGKSTYHISLLAVDPAENRNCITRQSTLSTAHDDGGVVTEYGYGYYSKESVSKNVSFSAKNIGYTGFVKYDDRSEYATVIPELKAGDGTDEDANTALAALMPGYVFHSWHSYHEGGRSTDNDVTGETYRANHATTGLCPINSDDRKGTVTPNNGSFTLTQMAMNRVVTVEFAVNPQFADSISVNQSGGMTLKNGASGDKPGTTSDHPYQVRCGAQLQEINWYDTAYTDVSVGFDRYKADRFPYLTDQEDAEPYYWKQTHDMDWTGEGNQYTVDGGKTYHPGVFFSIAETYIDNYTLPGWFGGTYDGGNYTMKNFNVGVNTTNYEVNCMGLFGVVRNAELKNIVLFSEQGSDIVTVKGRKAGTAAENCWYAGGTLVGLAQDSTISNCAVAGYTIVDETERAPSSKTHTIGGAIGGLVGMTDMDLTGCTASTTIRIKSSYDASDCTPVRVGGLVGSTAGSVRNCYTGGTIETADAKSTVRAGGVIGGTGMAALKGTGDSGEVTVESCYTYMTLPEDTKTVSAVPIGNGARVTSCYHLSGSADPDSGAVTYRQLEGRAAVKDGKTIYDLLPAFSHVTDKINGYSVAGRYSYPPASLGELQGMDYPFPTILTQDDGAYHVHYGAWPVKGILRPDGNAPIRLDVFTKPSYTEMLTLTEAEDGGTWTVENRDGGIAYGTVEDGKLTVTASEPGSTEVTVRYEKDGEEYRLTISVTVDANLGLKPSTVRMFPGDFAVLPLTPVGRDPDTGKEMELPDGVLEITEVSSGEELVCGPGPVDTGGGPVPGITLESAAGLKGGALYTVNVGYTYTAGGTEYPDRRSPVTVEILALPKIQYSWWSSNITIDFSEYGVSGLTAGVEGSPNPSPATVSVKNSTITIKPGRKVEEVPLEIRLHMDGLEHLIRLNVPAEAP